MPAAQAEGGPDVGAGGALGQQRADGLDDRCHRLVLGEATQPGLMESVGTNEGLMKISSSRR